MSPRTTRATAAARSHSARSHFARSFIPPAPSVTAAQHSLAVFGIRGPTAVSDPEVADGYDAFLAGNEEFKVLCTDWQLRAGTGEPVLNDHTDEAYDAAIV